ncbi:MAG: hypothetical protein ACR2Q4_03090 [Geminicoccaceae bacterium]
MGTTTTQPHLRGTSYGFDSFIPICMVASRPFYLVVDPSSGIESWDDFAAEAKGEGLTFTGPPQARSSMSPRSRSARCSIPRSNICQPRAAAMP